MNSIGIESTKQTIDALLNGASMFIVPIDFSDRIQMSKDMGVDMLYPDYISKYKEVHSKLQIGDEFFIQEEFKEIGCKAKNSPMSSYQRIVYSDHKNYNDKGLATRKAKVTNASQMTQEQSRYKGVVVDVEIKRVQEISFSKKEKLTGCTDESKILDYREHDEGVIWLFRNILKEQSIKYEDNPYVFLYTLKEVK